MSAPTWPEPWRDVADPQEAAGLVAELRREVASSHALAGQDLYAVARRDDMDDVLFAFADGSVVEVHLTWQVETGAALPAGRTFANADVWRAQLSGE